MFLYVVITRKRARDDLRGEREGNFSERVLIHDLNHALLYSQSSRKKRKIFKDFDDRFFLIVSLVLKQKIVVSRNERKKQNHDVKLLLVVKKGTTTHKNVLRVTFSSQNFNHPDVVYEQPSGRSCS